ncbi:MAG: hypothetical protein U1F34_06570 [Gammaproteobacteria bacterium]
MTFGAVAEVRTPPSMLRGQPRCGSHREKLQAFYAPQAEHYDRFRERLLRGRDELLSRLPLRPGDVLIELVVAPAETLRRCARLCRSFCTLKSSIHAQLCWSRRAIDSPADVERKNRRSGRRRIVPCRLPM